MQHKAVYLLFCKFTLHVSGVNHTHHQEYSYSFMYFLMMGAVDTRNMLSELAE